MGAPRLRITSPGLLVVVVLGVAVAGKVWAQQLPPADPHALQADIVPIECAELARIDDFIERIAPILGQWPRLTREQRRKQIGALMQTELEAMAPGVPLFSIQLKSIQPLWGLFRASQWLLYLNHNVFSRPRLTLEDEGHIVESTYHELCHSMQFLRMGRVRAARGHSAERIAKQLGLRLDAAHWTRARPWRERDPARQEAEAWIKGQKAARDAFRTLLLAARKRRDTDRERKRLLNSRRPHPGRLARIEERIAAAHAEEQTAKEDYQKQGVEAYAFGMGLVAFDRYVRKMLP